MSQLAVELVQTGPDVLIAGFGTLAAKAAIAATRTIPIVFTAVGDPVGAGLIKSLAQPGGNVSGVSALATDIAAKRLQMLNDIVPGKRLVAVLCNPDTPFTALALEQVDSSRDHWNTNASLRSKNVGRSPEGNQQGRREWGCEYAGAGGPGSDWCHASNDGACCQGPTARNLRSKRIRGGWRPDPRMDRIRHS